MVAVLLFLDQLLHIFLNLLGGGKSYVARQSGSEPVQTTPEPPDWGEPTVVKEPDC